MRPYSEMTLAELELAAKQSLWPEHSLDCWLLYRRGEKAGAEAAVPKFITEVWGEKCKDFDTFCACCQTWRAWKEYREALTEPPAQTGEG